MNEMMELVEDCLISCNIALQVVNDLFIDQQKFKLEIPDCTIQASWFLLEAIRPLRRQMVLEEKHFEEELAGLLLTRP